MLQSCSPSPTSAEAARMSSVSWKSQVVTEVLAIAYPLSKRANDSMGMIPLLFYITP